MKTIIPTNNAELVLFVEVAAAAAGKIGPAIGLAQNNENIIRAVAALFLERRDAYEAGRTELDAARTRVRSLTQAGREFLTLTRDILKPRLGSQYSQAWDATGFVGSLTLPTTMAAVPGYLQSMQSYLAANPELKVDVLDVTAARAGTLFTELCQAHAAVSEWEAKVDQLLNARNLAARKLRRRMRGLIEELDLLLEPLDERWKAFGFNMPGASETPEPVEQLELVSTGPGAAAASWIPAPRADRYRVFKQIVGVDAEPVALDTVYDPKFTFTGLTAGQTLKVFIVAANEAGEAEPSETIEIVVT